MRKIKALLLLSTMLSSGFSFAKDCYYLPDSAGGSGGWNDSTRWEGGNLPDAGDNVILNANHFTPVAPMSATITSADWEFLKKVARLQVADAKSFLTFDLGAQDVEWGGQIFGGGNVIKNGSGRFVITGSPSFSFGGTITVNGGYFRPGRQYQVLTDGNIPLVEVGVGAVFDVNAAVNSTKFMFRGLAGAGTVSNATGTAIQLVFADSQTAQDFTGKLGGKFDLTMGSNVNTPTSKAAGCQDLDYDDYGFGASVRLYAGTFGAKKFGVASGTGSFGTHDANGKLYVFGMSDMSFPEVRLVNLGTEHQTTDWQFRLMNGLSPTGIVARIDGGNYGGLDYAGEIYNATPTATGYWADHVTKFYLEGNHTNACKISGPVTEQSADNNILFVKRGSGTWRFADGTRQFKTPVIVERGTLEYDTIAEAGVNCALGRSNNLTTNWTGNASEKVPYAFYVGDGTPTSAADLATFRYTGTGAAICTTRPIGIVGAGVVENGGASTFSWSGIESAVGDSTLVLSGANGGEVKGLADGAGTLSVEKRGAGAWDICGDIGLSGSVYAKEGVVKIHSDRYFKWYKLTFKDTYSKDTSGAATAAYAFILSKIAFYDEDGVEVSRGLTYASAKNAHPSEMDPGTVISGNTDITIGSGGSLADYFTEAGNAQTFYRSSTPKIEIGNEKSWVTLYIRLPEGSKPAVKYDFAAGQKTNANVPASRTPVTWSVEASEDGVNWTPVSAVTDKTSPVYRSPQGLGDLYWLAKGEQFPNTTAPTGFEVSQTESSSGVRPTAVSAVGADTGATVLFTKSVSTSRLDVDVMKGMGVIAGVRFSSSGVLALSGEGKCPSSIEIDCDLSDCEDVPNLDAWTVTWNGKTIKRVVSASSSAIKIEGLGLMLLLR